MKAMNHIVVILALILALGCASVKPAGTPGAEISPDWPVMVWGTNSVTFSAAAPSVTKDDTAFTIYSMALVDIDARSADQIAAERGKPGIQISPSFWLKLVSIFKGRIRILCYEKVVQ